MTTDHGPPYPDPTVRYCHESVDLKTGEWSVRYERGDDMTPPTQADRIRDYYLAQIEAVAARYWQNRMDNEGPDGDEYARTKATDQHAAAMLCYEMVKVQPLPKPTPLELARERFTEAAAKSVRLNLRMTPGVAFNDKAGMQAAADCLDAYDEWQRLRTLEGGADA